MIWLLSAQIPVLTAITSSAAWKVNFSSISEVVWQIWSRAYEQISTQLSSRVLVLSLVVFGSQFEFFFGGGGVCRPFDGLALD